MKHESIYVTRPFLPPLGEYQKLISKIFENGQITNQGPLLKSLESELSTYCEVDNLHYISNGTVALSLALHALNITEGEVITTPFSYVATTSSILWKKLTPIFVDIEPENFLIDTTKIEEAITSKTKAIMPVHVFGHVCDIENIQRIADKYNLKVIYDGAHAFASKYKGKAVCSYGDISTLSFHATKLFHTIEGGACVVHDENISKNLELQKRFGHEKDTHSMLGINAKQSEMHAAMGLAIFPYINKIIDERKKISELYNQELQNVLKRPRIQIDLEYNYGYYPVVFPNEPMLLKVFDELNKENIFPRRYFYPSLNKLPYLSSFQTCPVSESISCRIACLPLYVGLDLDLVRKIARIIKGVINA